MKIEITREMDITNVNLSGRLDTNTSPELQSKLEDYYKQEEFQLVLNFAELEYVSSAGLRVILIIQKKANELKGKLTLKQVNPDIMEVFLMTGFLDLLTIE